MKGTRVKNKRRGVGFTLMELLIVVAVIAVLVAIAIPIFTNHLERARESVDQANSRSAIGVAAAGFMDGSLERETTYYFDLSGFTTTKPEPYGRGTESDQGGDYAYEAYGMVYDAGADYTQSVIRAIMHEGDDYPTVTWDRVGISVGRATSVAQVINGLRISNYWSEASGMPNGDGTYAHNDDLNWRTQIEGALADAGYETDSFSYQKDNDDTTGIFVTLDGKLEVDDVGSRVTVARYDTNTGEVTTGTARVVKNKHGRAVVAVTDFQAD